MKKLLSLLLTFITLHLFAQPADNILQNKMNLGRMQGASFLVIKDGKWLYNRNLGKANVATNQRTDSNTIYMMASVSKTMIATAIMQLWENGRISLDVNVERYLPYRVRTPSFPNDTITARMLLTHTAAIQDDWSTLAPLYVYGDSPVPLDSFLKNYFVSTGILYKTSNFYTYQPGTQYNYSNVGSTLAAYLVERVTGDAFSHYCDTAIFNKICMANSSFLLSDIADSNKIARPYTLDAGTYRDAGLYGYPDYPDGQLRSTVTDMARFMTMYLQNGTYEGARILDSSTVAYMLQQQTSVKWSQGIIFYATVASNGDTLWGHNGGDVGVNTAMYFNLKKKTGAIVLTNGDGTTGGNADNLSEMLYQYGLTATPGANSIFPPCAFPNKIPNTAQAAKELFVFPNPAHDILYVTMPVDGNIAVYDMQGRILLQEKANEGRHAITLANLAAGMYMIRATGANGVLAAINRFAVTK